MTLFLQRFVIALLLAWLPIQSSAMPVLSMLCEQEETSTNKRGDDVIAAHDHNEANGHSHADDDGDVADTAHNHGNGCCHHLFSAVIPVTLDALRESGSSLDLAPPSSLSSFFPEQPQRPPLA